MKRICFILAVGGIATSVLCLVSVNGASAQQSTSRVPGIKTPDPVQLNAHIEGIGEPGSFQLEAERDGCSKLIANVQVVKGRRTIFIDEVQLHIGAPNAMKQAGIKDYTSLRAAVIEQLGNLSSQTTGDAVPSDLQWPIKCVFRCPVHETCERYKWVGFF